MKTQFDGHLPRCMLVRSTECNSLIGLRTCIEFASVCEDTRELHSNIARSSCSSAARIYRNLV